MSKKARKARRPNIPLSTGPGGAAGGGIEMRADQGAGRKTGQVVAFNYTHIKKDLTRIGILAASFIAILVVLSFFLK